MPSSFHNTGERARPETALSRSAITSGFTFFLSHWQRSFQGVLKRATGRQMPPIRERALRVGAFVPGGSHSNGLDALKRG